MFSDMETRVARWEKRADEGNDGRGDIAKDDMVDDEDGRVTKQVVSEVKTVAKEASKAADEEAGAAAVAKLANRENKENKADADSLWNKFKQEHGPDHTPPPPSATAAAKAEMKQIVHEAKKDTDKNIAVEKANSDAGADDDEKTVHELTKMADKAFANKTLDNQTVALLSAAFSPEPEMLQVGKISRAGNDVNDKMLSSMKARAKRWQDRSDKADGGDDHVT